MKKLTAVFLLTFFAASVKFAGATAFNDGLRHYEQREWPAAVDSFKETVRREPQNSLAMVYYVVSSVWAGTADHLVSDLEEAVVDNPNDQQAELLLGFAYYAQEFGKGIKPAKSLAAFRDAARMGPSAVVHTGLGICYFDDGSLTRAKKELARALDLNNDDILAYEYMGRILLAFDNDPQSAREYFQKETKLAPEYPDGHFYYASALQAAGSTDEAIEQYKQTIELDRQDVGAGSDARVALGDLYAKLKQYPDAKRIYETALKLEPSNGVVKLRLAQLEKETNPKKKRQP